MTDSPPTGSNSGPTAQSRSSSPPPPIVYGELSILGYNGYIPNIERNGRRNRSKFLLCKRAQPNGIKKSRHYIVKQQPQSTKAIQDKELHSISYTFSRSQTIIVEYRQDENTDLFQIGRSSEDPIDFVVMDTTSANISLLDANMNQMHAKASSSNHQQHHFHSHNYHHHHNQHNENNARDQHNVISGDILSGIGRLHRHLAKVGEDYIYRNPVTNEVLARNLEISRQQAQAYLLNNPHANISNLPPIITEQIIRQHQESAIYQRQHQHLLNNALYQGQSSSSHQQQQLSPQQSQQLRETSLRSNNNSNNIFELSNNQHISSSSSRHNNTTTNNSGMVVAGSGSNSKRSHATQSTISRFACRILVDRNPPYTARVYAAGFDSSKNIFLGEKATKWEQNNTIDGLTTNGVLLMHPKRYGDFQKQTKKNESNSCDIITDSGDTSEGKERGSRDEFCSRDDDLKSRKAGEEKKADNISSDQIRKVLDSKSVSNGSNLYDFAMEMTNDEIETLNDIESGGVWREVSVDGGIYAIRESRSAAQKGTRINDESNILQDGTLIDLCGATLLWRSVEGFKASPSKKSLEDKIDLLNATRPQCPVGLNTLVIPRKPIIPSIHNHHDHQRRSHKGDTGFKDNDKTSHQPYVYLKCGHVQGYHDWGATDKLNERTCPICLAVGTVAKLSMGLEPSFYLDSGPLTRVFNPCGHMASERTIKYWSSIKIPHGTHFFHSICPFCATPLATTEPPSTKLIFQDDLD